MSSEGSTFSELADLIVLCLDGRSSEEQRNLLNRKLSESSAARKFYIDFLTTYIGLNYLEGDIALHEEQEQLLDKDIWRALSESERTAAAVEIPKPVEESAHVLINKVEYKKVPVKINKLSLTVAITASAALLILLAYVYFNPRYVAREVATVTDMIGPEFGDADKAVKAGSRLTNRPEALLLKKGIVKIEFDYGAETIIEGPAELKFLSPKEMHISYGRMYAKVPPTAIGFTANTPNSSIIDMGTEFGIRVNVDGSTDVHMYSGKASLVAGREGQTKQTQMIYAGTSKRVNQFEEVEDITFSEILLVKEISSDSKFVWRGEDINLADVVGGGNGFGTGRTGHGIDIATGNKEFKNSIDSEKGKGRYITAAQMPMVDGVFIPDGGSFETIVSSEGHVFKDCPDTNGESFMDIFNGGSILTSQGSKLPMILDGFEFGTVDRPAICLHPNAGITFDLDAIRQRIPGCEILQFSALCGISSNSLEYSPTTVNSMAGIFVLVDGEPRFEAGSFSHSDRPRDIKIDLEPTNRFLTLVSTDGECDNGADWVLFAEPYLVLTSAD